MFTYTALSIVAPHGQNIAKKIKTIEVRSWQPPTLPLRNLLIIENQNYLSANQPEDADGKAIAFVDILEVHEWQAYEVEAACSSGWQPGYWAWILSNVRPVFQHVTVPAKRKIYTVEVPVIEYNSTVT